MQDENAKAQLESIFKEHEKFIEQMEVQNKQLQLREQELRKSEIQNELEKKELKLLKDMYASAQVEQEKVVEDQKRQNEVLQQRILELETHLNAKQASELEMMERVRDATKHMQGIKKGESESKAALTNDSSEQLKMTEEKLHYIEDMAGALFTHQRKMNDELQDARKKLIIGLMDSKGIIGVKRMGKLEAKPFEIAMGKKYPKEEAQEKAAELCSMWEDYLRDPRWHPFKVIMVGEDAKEIIDEEDEKIISLKEYGEEVYEAVIRALSELNAYNPSGRYPVLELWNHKEKRKAPIGEGAEYILKQLKHCKQQKRR